MKKKVMIKNDTGIHARPASMLVEEAGKYDADVELIKKGQSVNAKSIMGIMSLGIQQSTEITIKAEGSDEQEAVKAIVKLIESGFGE